MRHTVMLFFMFLLFFRSVGTKPWSLVAGYENLKEAHDAMESLRGGGPFEFKIVYGFNI